MTPGRVLQILKTISGLNQLARAWAEGLHRALAGRGFQRSQADPALYVNRVKGEFVAVRVDDILYVSQQKSDFGEWLGTQFTVHDLGRLKYLLSIELDWGENSVSMHQSAILQRIVQKFLPSGARPAKSFSLQVRDLVTK